MAVCRPTEYCPWCNEPLKARYLDQSNIPFMHQIIGDTFLGYQECNCKNPEAKVIQMKEKMDEIRERDRKRLIKNIVENTKSF